MSCSLPLSYYVCLCFCLPLSLSLSLSLVSVSVSWYVAGAGGRPSGGAVGGALGGFGGALSGFGIASKPPTSNHTTEKVSRHKKQNS